jgi:hypothetical protein
VNQQAFIRCTLLADGTSDEALLPICKWVWEQHWPQRLADWQLASLQGIKLQPKGLAGRLKLALQLYPCDVLFVHRDAEKEPAEFLCIEQSLNSGRPERPAKVCLSASYLASFSLKSNPLA